MPLLPGVRVGSYEVLASVGAGGMGEVSRARDTKLHRDVALKVLPGSFMHDPERTARLRREAQVLASINHANIGAIHGIEDTDGITALVLEFVEGPTLADRIRGGPLPVADTLSIAKQIAEALDAAHERGIVHRDLKPANIKITPDGVVKVLDFGLAKAADAGSSGVSSSLAPTAAAMTQTGVIVGTAQYMSPEQARGQGVDKRTDIWAFGCVLFELLSGTPAFHGENASDVVANVLRGEPNWSALPPSATRLTPLVQRCLEKDVRRRFRDIGDVKTLLDDTLIATSSAVAPATVPARGWRTAAVAALGVIVGAAAVGFFVSTRPGAAPASIERFELASPAAAPFTVETDGFNVAIAPDASRLVYSSMRGGVPELIVRSLDQLEPQRIVGTDNGIDPFFSPDSEHIGFSTFTELKRVAATGGPVITICPIDAYYSGVRAGHRTIRSSSRKARWVCFASPRPAANASGSRCPIRRGANRGIAGPSSCQVERRCCSPSSSTTAPRAWWRSASTRAISLRSSMAPPQGDTCRRGTFSTHRAIV